MSPSANWEALHYVQRPAKNIERKLMIEVISRLARYRRLADFEYVGLGSLYFVDFVLMHRLLGVSRMTSIEDTQDEVAQARFRFNKPFKFVDLRFGHTNDELPVLSWRKPTIVWLDYTARMGDSVFADIETVVARAPRPCVLVVTVNAEPWRPVEEPRPKFPDRGRRRTSPRGIRRRGVARWVANGCSRAPSVHR